MCGTNGKGTSVFSRLRAATRKGCTPLLVLFLSAASGCAAKSDFIEASNLDTPAAYEAFLREHPEDEEYARKAEQRLEELLFQEARDKNTLEAYALFLKRFPHGAHAKLAQGAAEDIRADELGVHLYRAQPPDFYDWVDGRRLPYRIRVFSSSPEPAGAEHVERKWYEELVRRGLFVPMDPRRSYRLSPDLTLHVRESVIVLCVTPLALVDAEVRVRGTPVKRYRVAAGHIEKYLLYEIFKDRYLYDPLFRASKEAVQEVEEQFDRRRAELPLEGSLALEFDIAQQASDTDQEMSQAFVAFLRDLPVCEELVAYPRGHPSNRTFDRSLYFSVDQELHYPHASRRWNSDGSSVDWSAWNTKWILEDKEYFFKKMTLELLDLLEAKATP
jgi:hypothetical protein